MPYTPTHREPSCQDDTRSNIFSPGPHTTVAPRICKHEEKKRTEEEGNINQTRQVNIKPPVFIVNTYIRQVKINSSMHHCNLCIVQFAPTTDKSTKRLSPHKFCDVSAALSSPRKKKPLQKPPQTIPHSKTYRVSLLLQ